MTELLITSSVLITAIVLVRAALKNRVSARLIYALWLVAALRLMLPFELYPSQVSVMNAAPDAVLAGTVDIYEPQSAVTQNQYLYTDPEPAENQAPVDGTSQNLGSTQTNTAPSVPEQTADHETAINSAHLLSALWLAGTCCMAVYFVSVNAVLYIRLRRHRRALELPYAVRPVYLDGDMASPCLFGLIRPAVYLTPAALESEERTRMVVLHEETHYRHCDHIWALLRCLLLCVYWFDPFVWLAAYLSRRDAELACDESCMKALGRSRSIDYGHALIDLLDHGPRRTNMLHTATTMSCGKRAMKARILRIVSAPKTRWAAAAAALILIVTVSACTFTGPAAESSAPSDGLDSAAALTNVTAFSRLPDGSVMDSRPGHDFDFNAETGELKLNYTDGETVTAALPAKELPGVFLSDTLAAVGFIDTGGALNAWVSHDRGRTWANQVRFSNETLVNSWNYIGFSTAENGWLVHTYGQLNDGAGIYTSVWLTEDGGQSWVQAPNLPVEGALSGFAVTPGGTAACAVTNGSDAYWYWSNNDSLYGTTAAWTCWASTDGYSAQNQPLGDSFNGTACALAPRANGEEIEFALLASPAGGEDYVYTQTLSTDTGAVKRWRIPEARDADITYTDTGYGLRLTSLEGGINSPVTGQFWLCDSVGLADINYENPGQPLHTAAYAGLYTDGSTVNVQLCELVYTGGTAPRVTGESLYFTLTGDMMIIAELPDPGENPANIGVIVTDEFGNSHGWALLPGEDGSVSMEPLETLERYYHPADSGCGLLANYADGSDLGVYAGYDYVPYGGDGEYAVDVLLYADRTLRNVRVFSVQHADNTFEPMEVETLYSAAELAPQRPLVVGTVFWDFTATRGVAFTDESGIEHRYILLMSGYDGSIILSPM